jgi:hypothetical protein
MNPLEIYKLLPKKNCGECPQKTCMSFAVALQADPDCTDKCTYLEPEKLSAIKSMLTRKDWRDDLIGRLKGEVSKLDIFGAASGLGCSVKGNKLIVRCIGQDYSIARDGTISPDARNKWIAILLLHYVRSKGEGQFTGKWIDFEELKGGFVKKSTFVRDCEEPLRQLMNEDLEMTASMLRRLGATRIEGFKADYACILDLLPKVRTLILYHKGDDELPSSLKIVFDGATGNFLDVESLVFLCEGLAHTLTGMLRYSKEGAR